MTALSICPQTVFEYAIAAALWFLARDRTNHRFRDRSGKILFIDTRNLGEMINRRQRILTQADIEKISSTCNNWRNKDGKYGVVKGFCASVPISGVAKKAYALTPGRYVACRK